MATMAREMFGVQRTTSSNSGGSDGRRSGREREGSAPARRPEGVPRELFMLTGGVTPASLMPAAPAGLQSKPTARRKWARTAFHRTGKDDGLVLRHWAPVGQPHDSYAFARFNKPVRMITYTEAEYEVVIANLHPLNVDKEALAAFEREKRNPASGSGQANSSQVKTLKAPRATVLAVKASARIEKMSRLKKEEAEQASATSAPSAATTGPSAAPIAPAVVSTSTTQPASSPSATPITPTTPAARPQPQAQVQSQSKPQAQPQSQPKAQVAAQPQAQTQTQPKPQTQPQTKAQPQVQPQPQPHPQAQASSLTAAPFTKATKATSSPPATNKTLKDIMSPIVKGPSAAPPSSVAAGTRKTINASPKALALAAEAAKIDLPDPSAKPPRPPKSPRLPKSTRSSRRSIEPEPAAATAEPNKPKPKPAQSQPQAAPTGESLHYVKPQKPWTRAETDELFDLCGRFDLRFPVIHDRWPETFEKRTVEELKDRYYSVAKAVIEYRQKNNKEGLTGLPLALQKHCQAITMNPYDYEYECTRKNQLEWQYRRSKAELREEEETVREARRIESARKRQAKERQRLAKLMAGPGNGAEAAAAASAAAALGSSMKFSHRKQVTGAYARSSHIYTPVSSSQRSSKRIDAALNELGVGTRPTPTQIVVDNFDLLRIDILQFIELQRTVAKKEEDVYSLRVKLAKLKGENPPPPPPGVNLSHKKRKMDEFDFGSLFGPPTKKTRTS